MIPKLEEKTDRKQMVENLELKTYNLQLKNEMMPKLEEKTHRKRMVET